MKSHLGIRSREEVFGQAWRHRQMSLPLVRNSIPGTCVSPCSSIMEPSKWISPLERSMEDPIDNTIQEEQTKAASLLSSSSESPSTSVWNGKDIFTDLNDRVNAPPLELPKFKNVKKRVTLVRHGQSTWNALERIQGSSDFSVLTTKGINQAEAARMAMEGSEFDALFASPLRRAALTAKIVWGERDAPAITLPSLREIDLYTFQGLYKSRGKIQYPEKYEFWQRVPHEFEIDGHWPVRELWYRSSLAWKEVLESLHLDKRNVSRTLGETKAISALVVAHNAVNQALICTAIGLPPDFFRRFVQTNAAHTILDFEWDSQSEVSVGINQFNCIKGNHISQKSTSPSNSTGAKMGPNQLILIAGDRDSTESRSIVHNASVQESEIFWASGSPTNQACQVEEEIGNVFFNKREESFGRNRICAVVSPTTVQKMLDRCLGAEDVGRKFVVEANSISIINYSASASGINKGSILCVNQTMQN